jgi:hypothetical protein
VSTGHPDEVSLDDARQIMGKERLNAGAPRGFRRAPFWMSQKESVDLVIYKLLINKDICLFFAFFALLKAPFGSIVDIKFLLYGMTNCVFAIATFPSGWHC